MTVAPALFLIAVGALTGAIGGGFVADRFDRIGLASVALAVSGVCGLAAFVWPLHVVFSVAAGFGFGLANAASRVPFMAIVLGLSERNRGALNGLIAMSHQVGWALGAGLGGWILAVAGYRGLGQFTWWRRWPRPRSSSWPGRRRACPWSAPPHPRPRPRRVRSKLSPGADGADPGRGKAQMTDSAGKLEVGLKYWRTVTVTDEMTPAHLRHEPIRVLSTPDMIRLIEQTAIEAVQPGLAAGQATVGTRVDVAHLAATPVGMTVTITVELTEIDRRRLAFRVEVRDEMDEAGKGTHERFIVDGAQRLPRLQDKMNRWKAAGGKPA